MFMRFYRGFSLIIVSILYVFPAYAESRIPLMFYNVLNLFDAEHDEGKDDWTFLPRDFPGKTENCRAISNSHYREECLNTDWTDERVEEKLDRLATAIRSVSNQYLPDIIGLAEVENDNVVGRLAEKLEYEYYITTNSADARGIDVALIFNNREDFSYVEHYEYQIESDSLTKPTRNILEVAFNAGGKLVYLYVNHWPSQGAPAIVRNEVASALMSVIEARYEENNDASFIIMGDFNTIDSDRPHPFSNVILSRENSVQFYDVYDLYKSLGRYAASSELPAGTYYYRPDRQWNRLDRFFVSHNLAASSSLRVDPVSYGRGRYLDVSYNLFGRTKASLNNDPIQGLELYNVGYDIFPEGYVPDRLISDHYPVLIDLIIE